MMGATKPLVSLICEPNLKWMINPNNSEHIGFSVTQRDHYALLIHTQIQTSLLIITSRLNIFVVLHV
jgi:hypothetical protein